MLSPLNKVIFLHSSSVFSLWNQFNKPIIYIAKNYYKFTYLNKMTYSEDEVFNFTFYFPVFSSFRNLVKEEKKV